jgi:hypothetical protein
MLQGKPSEQTLHRSGAVTAWVVVCLSVIVGILALGMDGGRMMEERRAAQAAADAAALAAANDLYNNYQLHHGTDPKGTARAAALASAAANGYSNDGTSSSVTVNIPPLAGPFTGKSGCVEVVIQSNLAGTFSAVFTRGPLAVRGRGVAEGKPKDIGLILLQSTGSALTMSGSASLQVMNAPIVTNSSSTLVYSLAGTTSVSAQYHDLAAATLAASAQVTGTVNTGVAVLPDPLKALPNPNSAGNLLTQILNLVTGVLGALLPVTIQPGVYDGGLSIPSNANVTLAPGVYDLNGGGLTVGSGATLSGDGVVIYNSGGASAGSINIAAGASVRLTPPTSGAYQGISIYQDPGLTNTLSLSTSGSLQITGLVYAPSASVQINVNIGTSATLGGGYIVNDLTVAGTGTVVIDHGSVQPRVPQIGLIE